MIIWPDHDEPGIKYGRYVATHLSAIGCTVRIVEIPPDKPRTWDAADCIKEGGDPAAHITNARPFRDTAARKTNIRILDIDELAELPPMSWLIDNVLSDHGLSVLWGKYGTLKTFVALDMAMAIATGTPWHGHPVKYGPVVYIAGEGAFGLAKRAQAWRATKGREAGKPRFKLIPQALNLTDPQLHVELINALLELEEQPALIAVDTLARTLGSRDENKQADMNMYVGALDEMREVTGANVLVLHHGGKDESAGSRGSTVLPAAADTVIYAKRTSKTSLQLINEPPQGKQKDADEFKTIKLRTQEVEYQHNNKTYKTLVLMADDGDPVSRSAVDGVYSDESVPRLGQVEKSILAALRNAATAGRPLGFTSLRAVVGCNQGTLSRALHSLVEKKLVLEVDDPIDPNGKRRLYRLA